MTDELVTAEMKVAMQFLRSQGIAFHETRRKTFACGCHVLGGWNTETHEGAVGIEPCSPEHQRAAERARAAWSTAIEDGTASATEEGYVALARLMGEEIGG